MKKAEFYMRTTGQVFTTFIVSTIVACLLMRNTTAGSGRESVGIAILFTAMFNIALAISSLSVFLNAFKTIRSSYFYCFLSYYLLPGYLLIWGSTIIGKVDSTKDWLEILEVIGPFFLIHTVYFIRNAGALRHVEFVV